jgi:hypothetical protein
MLDVDGIIRVSYFLCVEPLIAKQYWEFSAIYSIVVYRLRFRIWCGLHVLVRSSSETRVGFQAG